MIKDKSMSNIIQFPTSERVKQVIDEKIDKVIDEEERLEIQKEECVELAHYCFQLMDQAICNNEFIDGFEDMDFYKLDTPEMKDMSVVINNLAAMFNRYKGLNHPFQEDLDAGDKKLITLVDSNFEDSDKIEEELRKIEESMEELLTDKSEEDDID